MDLALYMENAGVTAGTRALFSYMTDPPGSYYLPMIFSNVLRKKHIRLTEEEKHRWNNFLADYFVFRFYTARHVLKTYARDYTPLLYAFRGLSKLEAHFPEFLDPSGFRRDERNFLTLSDADLSAYTAEQIEEYHSIFEDIARKAELRFTDPNRVMKAIAEEALYALAQKNKVPLYTPVFWFFHKETRDYADYLSSFFAGFIPAPDNVPADFSASPEEEQESDPDDFYTSARFPAAIALAAMSALAFALYAAQ